MKKLLLIGFFVFASLSVYADHLKGGFFTYQYIGPGSSPNTLKYRITLTVYMVCNPNSGQLSQTIPFTIFDAGSGAIVQNTNVTISQQYQLSRNYDDPCIKNELLGCYYLIVVYDLPSIELPSNANGYVVAYQRCCRIINIQNIAGTSSNYGNTYAVKIPGSNVGQNAQQNSSATFQVNDTAIVCHNNYFQTSFLASDPDGDSLSYSFCDSWAGGTTATGTGPNSSTPNPAASPTSSSPLIYPAVPYATGFTGTTPMGSSVTINSKTGLISGIAPSAVGMYVITVCVNEYRNGVLIATNRKELLIVVGDCGGVKATLNPSYITCDGFNLSFSNNTPSGISSYFWDFGVTSLSNDTANISNPTFSYSDTGTYLIKLVVNKGQTCSDSTTTVAKVYPGFFPGFTYAGVCINKTTQFFDTTKTVYGSVNTWRWDFGDNATLFDTSQQQNPTYTYGQAGNYSVQFIVSNSKGCVDTVIKEVNILSKPPLSVVFKDTLICNGDSVQLHAIGNGNFSWTPVSRIINESTADPTVFPTTTTKYFVLLDDQGCLNNDTVQVRVVNAVTLQAMADTTICSGDTLRLRANTDGLKFLWSPASSIVDDPTLLRPLAHPAVNTTYVIKATIGRCSATDDVNVRLVPYPVANAGSDTAICYNTEAQLNGSTDGSSFNWSPTTSLTNANILAPIATPKQTTTYILTAYDTRGCPKPGRDSVVVKVNPQIIAFAGRDTAIVIGQPLQLNGTGGVNYLWSPATGLNKIDIANPVGFYDGSFDSIRYTVTVTDAIGCSDVATVLVKIFKTNPQVFVPTAFTPNGDGKNDVIRPIAVGLTKLDYFRIYNRWGQLVFETTTNGKGWDGKISGQPQSTDTYVWIVKGTDFTGKSVFQKGTVTLIR